MTIDQLIIIFICTYVALEPHKDVIERYYSTRSIQRTPTKSYEDPFPTSGDPWSPVIKGDGSVASLKAQLNVERLQDILQEFKLRYASHPDTQLQALLENTEYYLANENICMLPFGSKRFALNEVWIEGCYAHVPEVFRSWLIETLTHYDDQVLQTFFDTVVFGLLELQKDISTTSTIRTSLGYQIFLQILLRHFRQKLRLLDVVFRLTCMHPNFLANPSLAHTMIWLMAQNVQPNDAVIWLEYFLPAFTESATSSTSSVKSLSLDLMERILEACEAVQPNQGTRIYIAANRVESLMLLVNSSKSLLASPQSNAYFTRLQLIYGKVKEAILSSASSLTSSSPKLFYAVLSHASAKDDKVKMESLSFASQLLAADAACFAQWQALYEDKLAESALLLQYLKESWSSISNDEMMRSLANLLKHSQTIQRKRARRAVCLTQMFMFNLWTFVVFWCSANPSRGKSKTNGGSPRGDT